MSLLTQAARVPAGGSWAYYLRVWQSNGKPWTGTVSIAVLTPQGKTVDDVGLYPFRGSLLSSYIWNAHDRGHRYRFTITLLQNHKPVGTSSSAVRVT